MIIKIESSRDFIPALIEEFRNNPNAINDMADHVASNAKSIAEDVFKDVVKSEKYLKDDNITLKVSVEFGNTNNFIETPSVSLSTEERGKLIEIYADLKDGLSNCHEECVYDALEKLEDIFGKEFFNGE